MKRLAWEVLIDTLITLGNLLLAGYFITQTMPPIAWNTVPTLGVVFVGLYGMIVTAYDDHATWRPPVTYLTYRPLSLAGTWSAWCERCIKSYIPRSLAEALILTGGYHIFMGPWASRFCFFWIALTFILANRMILSERHLWLRRQQSS